MQFHCDSCGKRYSTSQEIREGRSYRFKCRACGSEVIVRGPPSSPATSSAPTPAPRGIPPQAGDGALQAGNGAAGLATSSAGASAGLPPPAMTSSVVNPGEGAAPEGGYVEFRLDDDVVNSQVGITATRTLGAITQAESVILPAPPAATSERLSLGQPRPAPAMAGKRRGLLVAAVVLPAALVVAASLLVGMPARRGAPEGAAQAVPQRAPGLLTPTVYVGPVAFDEPVPPIEVAGPVPGPSRPGRPAVAPARRGAARERGRGAEPTAAAPAPQPVPAEKIVPEPAPPSAASQPAASEPAAPAPTPPSPPPLAAAPAAPTSAAPANPVPLPPPPDATLDTGEPLFARAGFRRPAAVTPGCIERGIRIPADVASRLPPSVVLRFAVGRSGSADLISVLPGADMGSNDRVETRLGDALRSAVQSCRFTPGADDLGRPARIWVSTVVRFGG